VEVLVLLARAASTRQIGRRLGVIPKTAGNHIERIYASWSRSLVGVLLPNPTNAGGGTDPEEVDQADPGAAIAAVWPATGIRSPAR
jgi:hypothetical protein